MNDHKFLLVLLALSLLLSFLVLKPFLAYILFAIILAVVLHPVYEWVKSLLRFSSLSAIVVIALIILLIVIPIAYLGLAIFLQASDIATSLIDLKTTIISKLSSTLSDFGIDIDISENILALVSDSLIASRTYFLNNIVSLTSAVTNFFVGLFLSFVIMFYLFVDGKTFVRELRKVLPLEERHKNYLLNRAYLTTQGLFLGLFLTAFAQGMIAAIGYYFFGVPNALFWGFVTSIVALIPLLGPPVVYVPLSLFLFTQGNIIGSIGLLAYGFVLVSNIDNVMRAHFVRIRSDVHPLIIISGAIGGVVFLGFVGIIIGPLILALSADILLTYFIVNKRKR